MRTETIITAIALFSTVVLILGIVWFQRPHETRVCGVRFIGPLPFPREMLESALLDITFSLDATLSDDFDADVFCRQLTVSESESHFERFGVANKNNKGDSFGSNSLFLVIVKAALYYDNHPAARKHFLEWPTPLRISVVVLDKRFEEYA